MTDVVNEVAARDEERRSIDSQISALRARQSELAAQIDELRLGERPSFPTDEQREGIIEAARRIREEIVPKSHHGDPCGSYVVVVDGRRSWLSIRDGAPYSAHGARKLWSFGDDDLEALFELLREQQLSVVSHWLHVDGVSIIVKRVPS